MNNTSPAGDGIEVDVYFNLHKRVFSLRARKGPERGRVIAHRDHVTVTNATFVVGAAGRQRVIDTGQKNVHAFVRGTIDNTNNTGASAGTAVSYNPYRFGHFYERETLAPVSGADIVELNVTDGVPTLTASTSATS